MDLKSWPRPHYCQGGGDAFVMYQVFGTFTGQLDISGAKHRTKGLPDGVQILHHDRGRHSNAFDWFKPGNLWKSLQAEQPELAEAVDASPGCLRIQGQIPDPPTLDFLRDVVGMVTATLENGGAVVLDPQILKGWSPKDWRTDIFDPNGPVPRHHVIILTSEDETSPGTEWIHTRGMRKFGRPDLSIHAVVPEYRQAVVDLCNRFIELQAFGGLIPEGQSIRMSGLPQGMICHHRGDLEDPDFNNVHVEVSWP